MDFRNFFISYVFDVEESIFDSFTKLSCSDDLKNPSQLPVLQVLEAIDDWVSWIFVIHFSLRSHGPGIDFSQFHEASVF